MDILKGKNLVHSRIMKLNPEYQFIVNPRSQPTIHIPIIQQQIHDKQELPSEKRHYHLEVVGLVIIEKGKLRVQDEQENQHNEANIDPGHDPKVEVLFFREVSLFLQLFDGFFAEFGVHFILLEEVLDEVSLGLLDHVIEVLSVVG